jgi:hypothetical protein
MSISPPFFSSLVKGSISTPFLLDVLIYKVQQHLSHSRILESRKCMLWSKSHALSCNITDLRSKIEEIILALPHSAPMQKRRPVLKR